jgi:Na+-transporting methylmalonyl-CoA/oxaloacetate decarboxylase gamma subunit
MLASIQVPPVIEEGIVIAITGYAIVFIALLLLYYLFSGLSKFLTWQVKQKLIRTGRFPKHIKEEDDIHISGEITAAIAMAIFLCRDLHDDESNVLTIKKVSKTYSPWSSKIYGVSRFSKK